MSQIYQYFVFEVAHSRASPQRDGIVVEFRTANNVLSSSNLSLTAFAAENVNLREAAILIVSPVAGLRPSRAGVLFTLNFSKPLSAISSPFAAASAMASNTESTIFFASTLIRLLLAATCSTS